MRIRQKAQRNNQGTIGPWTLESGRALLFHLKKRHTTWTLTADFLVNDLTPDEYCEYQHGPRKEVKQYLWMILRQYGQFVGEPYNELVMNALLAKAGL